MNNPKIKSVQLGKILDLEGLKEEHHPATRLLIGQEGDIYAGSLRATEPVLMSPSWPIKSLEIGDTTHTRGIFLLVH